MIAWFLIAIGTIAFFAYIAITGVTTTSAPAGRGARAGAGGRPDSAAALVLSQSAAPFSDGVLYAPAPVAGPSYSILPPTNQSAGVATSGGAFVYCPMGAPLDTANATVTYPGTGGSYGIRTSSLDGTNYYVVTGRPGAAAAQDPTIIAFVIEPLSSNQSVAGCEQITAAGTGFTAPGSIVRAVRRPQSVDVDSTRALGGDTWYVSPTGTGNGSSISSPTSMQNALTAYANSLGGSFVIRMANGSYSVTSGSLDQTMATIAVKKEASTLVLVGNGSSLSLGAQISVPSNLELYNLGLGTSIVNMTPEKYAIVNGSTTGPIIVNAKARLQITGGDTVSSTSSYPALTILDGGDVVMQGNNTFNYYANQYVMSLDAGSRMLIYGSTQSIQPYDTNASNTTAPISIVTNAGSMLTMKYTTIASNIPTSYGFQIAGGLSVYGTSFTFNKSTYVGLQTIPGGRVVFQGGSVINGSSPPTYGIAGQYSSYFGGSGTINASSRCWYQGESSLQRYSALGIAGNNAGVSADEPDPYLDPTPTAQEVRDLQGVRERNAERVDLRTRSGGSALSCNAAGTATWTTCAAENGYCTLPTDNNGKGVYRQVRYGYNGTFFYRGVGVGVACNNNTFGDPSVGNVKSCAYLN